MNALPGLKSLPLQSTYLAWVDFSGTGMSREEFIKRLREDAKIATSPGDGFGTGGEFMERFKPRHSARRGWKRPAAA